MSRAPTTLQDMISMRCSACKENWRAEPREGPVKDIRNRPLTGLGAPNVNRTSGLFQRRVDAQFPLQRRPLLLGTLDEVDRQADNAIAFDLDLPDDELAGNAIAAAPLAAEIETG